MNDHEKLFWKAFEISELDGWYLEFGCYEGGSFQRAYHIYTQIVKDYTERFTRRGWYSDFKGADEIETHFRNMWATMRFVAFDSFEGMPESKTEADQFYKIWPKGVYECSDEKFRQRLANAGVDLSKVITVPGFFDKTLNPGTAERIGLKRISVAHIDSDLYESAKAALEFCGPHFHDGSIVVFDEWFQFRGNPFLGERRAFSEWLAENPEWHATDIGDAGSWTKGFILSKHPGF